MPYNKVKEDRKRWWNSLSAEQKSTYTKKWETRRNVPDHVELDVPPLTPEQMKEINDNMRRIGMAEYIVLPEQEDGPYIPENIRAIMAEEG